MSMEAIRTAIVAKLNTVPGIGVVHAYQRYAASEKKFRDLYVTDGKLLGFFVRRISTREVYATSTWSRIIHDWRIEGFMAFEDGEQSEILFDRLIEAIRDVFRHDETLGGAVNTTFVDDRAGLQLEDTGPAMFNGTLCHHARLMLRTETDCDLAAPGIDDLEGANITWNLDRPSGMNGTSGKSGARDTVTVETCS